jgi:hypothetical protein
MLLCEFRDVQGVRLRADLSKVPDYFPRTYAFHSTSSACKAVPPNTGHPVKFEFQINNLLA